MASTKDRDGKSKQNYTCTRYGNDHGSLSFGHLHQTGDVTAAVMIQAPDGRHQLSLDKDGPRKGWTSMTSPRNFQVECGLDNKEQQDSMLLHAKNGNVLIISSNGKIRLQGTDIELIAVGQDGKKGNIKMKASENIETESKKLIMNAQEKYKLATAGTGEVISNTVLKMYGSIIRGVSDAIDKKDSKVGGQAYQQVQKAIGT